ncbi:hypothetical protein ACHHYP_12411 [Achlya hypogyna]|uniref:U1-type domain-containing protein n=1 Tax=Achlya hypogyna TaxID=1202772 RepID=A0A1V9YH54_ACHHY|nr:hypothetical protein ACHHYP_12411 [Achlya hypogyna]
MTKGTKRPREAAPRGRALASNSFVVVNPSLLRAAATEAPAAKKIKTTEGPTKIATNASKAAKAKETPAAQSKQSSQKPKAGSGVYHCEVCNLDVTVGAKAMHEQGKKHQRALAGAAPAVIAAATTKQLEVAPDSMISKPPAKKTPPAPVQFVHVARHDDVIGAVYALLEQFQLRRAVVVVPNKGAPQVVAGALKHLGFAALALHAKTAATQRAQALDRFRCTTSCLLVTTEHLAKGIASDCRIFAECRPAAVGSTTLVVVGKVGAPDPAWVPVTPWRKPVLQKAVSRAAMAQTIHELTIASSDADGQWLQKLASASGLEDSEAKAKRAAPSAAQQKLAAVAEKLFLSMGYPLTHTGRVDLAVMKDKMACVGLHVQTAATGLSLHATRLSAQTRWLDVADGAAFGGAWSGAVRHGATKDETSLAVRQAHFQAAAREWQPNPEPSDATEWGGPFGKPCGHNEVVMHHLRPFFPQEVLNARICCKDKPAPGNDGFDGCLEHLQLKCKRDGRAMTVWDAEQWVYITPDGQVARLSKTRALHLPLPLLKWTMNNLRMHTLRCEGQVPPAQLIRALQYLVFCGGVDGDKVWGLPQAVRQMIVGFLVTGSSNEWKRLVPLQQKSA